MKLKQTVYFSVHATEPVTEDSYIYVATYPESGDGYIPLGSRQLEIEVDVKATTLASIDALKAQLEKHRAEAAVKENKITDAIANLLCIEN